MKLTELYPSFLKIVDDRTSQEIDDIAQAHGISFLCPVCFLKNKGPVGTHSMICWFNNRGVPPDKTPGPGRWNPSGTGYADLTFVGPGATSVLLQGHAHFHIENGEIKLC